MNDCSISKTILGKASQLGWEVFANQMPGLVPEPGSPNHPMYWRPGKVLSPRSQWEDRPVLYSLWDVWGNSLYVGHATNLWERITKDHGKTSWWENECFFVFYLDYDLEREDRYITDLEDWLIKNLDPKYNVRGKYRKVSDGYKLVMNYRKEFKPLRF